MRLPHLFAALTGFVGPFLYFYPFCGPYHGFLSDCKMNCKRLYIALDLYASDHKGRYPATLEVLVHEGYLTALPTCPAAGRSTYFYRRSGRFEKFRFACAGNNHARAYTGFSSSSNNFPRYDNERGLVPHP